MYKRSGFLALTTVGIVLCTAGLTPSVSQAAGGTGDGKGSYADSNGLTADDVRLINALNEEALDLGRPGKTPGGDLPSATESLRASAAAGDRVTPPAEPLDRMPDAYRAHGDRATTGISNYIRKWQQVYSHRDGRVQQMTEQQREQLSYGCVGVTWVNSGPYPTNKLAFASFDEEKHRNALENTSPRPGETRAEFEGRIAKQSYDETKGFNRARDVASVMNKALESSPDESTYLSSLKAELTKNDDALAAEDSRSNFYSALRNTPSFKDRNGGNHDPSKMKAVIYSKHFWSGQAPGAPPTSGSTGTPTPSAPTRTQASSTCRRTGTPHAAPPNPAKAMSTSTTAGSGTKKKQTLTTPYGPTPTTTTRRKAVWGPCRYTRASSATGPPDTRTSTAEPTSSPSYPRAGTPHPPK